MKMQLEHGRPKDETDRQAREIRVYDLLAQLGIDFWRVDHDAARTMEDCAQADRLLGEDTAICKNLFLRNSKGSQYYLLMLPGEKKFRGKDGGNVFQHGSNTSCLIGPPVDFGQQRQ